MPSGQELIESREATHGDYRSQATTSQQFKEVARKAPNWERMSPAQRESIELIAVKMSRILHGNPDEPEHWEDISGYSTMNANIIRKGTHL